MDVLQKKSGLRRPVLVALVAVACVSSGLALAAGGDSEPIEEPANYVSVMLKPQLEYWRARSAGTSGLSSLKTEGDPTGSGGDGRVLVTMTPPNQASVVATFQVGTSKNGALAPITALDGAAARIGAFPSPGAGSRLAVRGVMTGWKRRGRGIAVRLDPPQSLSVQRLHYLGHHPRDPLGVGLGLSERAALEFHEVYVDLAKTTRLHSGKRRLSYRSLGRLFERRGYTAVQIEWARAPRLNTKGTIVGRAARVNLVRKW